MSMDNLKKLLETRENSVKTDFFVMNFYKIEICTKEALNDSFILSVLGSAGVLAGLHSKYLKSLKHTKVKKISPVKVDVAVKTFSFICEFNTQILKIQFFGLKLSKFPSFCFQASQKVRNARKKKLEIKEKKENFEEKTLIYIKTIQLSLNHKTYLTFANNKIISSNHTIQQKNYSLNNQKFRKIKHENTSTTEIIINSILLETLVSKSSRIMNLFAIPCAYDVPPYNNLNPKSFAINCMIKQDEFENTSNSDVKVSVQPLGIFARAKSIAKIQKIIEKLLSSDGKSQVLDVFNVFSLFLFDNKGILEEKVMIFNLFAHEIIGSLFINKTELSKIRIKDIEFSNIKDTQKFEGKISFLSILAENEKYDEHVLPLSENSTNFEFFYCPTKNLLNITVSDLKLVFLNNFIEKNLSFFDYISSKNPKTSKKISKNEETPSVFTVEVVFINSALVLPKNSQSDEMLLAKFTRAQLTTHENQEID